MFKARMKNKNYGHVEIIQPTFIHWITKETIQRQKKNKYGTTRYSYCDHIFIWQIQNFHEGRAKLPEESHEKNTRVRWILCAVVKVLIFTTAVGQNWFLQMFVDLFSVFYRQVWIWLITKFSSPTEVVR